MNKVEQILTNKLCSDSKLIAAIAENFWSSRRLRVDFLPVDLVSLLASQPHVSTLNVCIALFGLQTN